MKQLLVAALLCVGCATFNPSRASDSILQMRSTDGGNCTVWAVAPSKWMTAKHCFQMDPGPWAIGGTQISVIAQDPQSDLAIVSGPSGQPLQMADTAPSRGEAVTTWGYSSGPTLLVFQAVVISPDADFFTNSPHEFIIGGANGMPGMSGGPILSRGRVVSQITGGGPAPSAAHLVGSGVSFTALSAFVRLHTR